METLFFIYIFLVLLGLTYSLINTNEKLNYYIAFFLLLIFSITARFSVVKLDMITYTDTMQFDFLSYMNIYYLREPIYWLSSKYLYDLIGDTRIVLIIIDIIFFIFLLYIFYKNKIQVYFVFLFFCFFVSILGFQNVYRQYLATIIIFCTIFFINKGFIYKSWAFLFSTLVHNVSILFYPLVIAGKKKNSYLYSILLGGVVFVFTYLLSGSKSNSETGDVPPVIYFIFIFILFLFHMIVNKMKFKGEDLRYLYFYLYSLVLMAFCSFLLGSAQLKRVGMICLILSLFIVYDSIERKFVGWNKIFTRVLFFILAISPCFFSSTVRDFLLI